MLQKISKANKTKNKYTITFITSVCFLSILIVQSLIIFFNFILLNTDEKLDQNTYSYALKRVDDTSKEIERYMSELWSNQEYINPLKINIQDIYTKTGDDKEVKVDKKMANAMLKMMNLMKVSGAFVAFNNVDEKTHTRHILHLRDSNEDIAFENMSDITMRMGSERIARDMSISLESSWEPFLKLNSDKENIYEKSIRYARVYNSSDNKNEGFWISPIEVFDSGQRSIYYIQPVYDSEKKLYAVIGIEIKQQLIEEILRYSQLTDSEKGAYFLISNKNGEISDITCDIIAMKGPYLNRFVDDFKITVKKIKNKYYNVNSKVKDTNYIYSIVSKKEEDDFIAIQRPVRISTRDFQKNATMWYLMAVIDRNEIESYSKELMKSLSEMIFISILIGFVFIYFVSHIITYPITKLSNNINEFYKNDTIRKNTKLNIKELDNLIEMIEELSFKLLKSSKKFQKILESSAIPLVAIEMDFENDLVYKLGEISSIFPGYSLNEKFEEKMSLENYRRWSKRFFHDSIIVDSIHDLDKESQIDIRKKEWKGKTYYIKIVQKKIDRENMEYINEDTFSNTKEKKIVTLQIITDNTKEMLEKLQIQRERDYDFLTGLLNRLSFKEQVENYIRDDKDKIKKAVMIMWDLDNLKYVNDTYGHDNGDEYLKLAGKIISELKNDGAFVARVSGDEFFAFLKYNEDKDEVRRKIENIREKFFQSSLMLNGKNIRVRATTGVSWYPEDASNYEDLKKYADFAMYKGKSKQKGSIKEFKRKSYEKDYILFSGKEDLNMLIEEREVKFVFQPIVSAVDGSVYGYEALLRPNPSTNIKTVEDVMRLAKSQSRLTDIEMLTVEGVFERVNEELDKLDGKYVFINSIASVTIPQYMMESVVRKYGSFMDKIVIEIIESEDVDDKAMQMKQELKRKYNTKIAIDDFGSGYSAESRLLQFPDFVKIDMQFIRDIHKDEAKQVIVSNMLRYRKEQNIKVICEGVENYQEMEKLIQMGADYLQGFYLGMPEFEIKDIKKNKKREIQTINALKLFDMQ